MPIDQLCKELYERYELDKISKEDLVMYETVFKAMADTTTVDSRYARRVGKSKVYKGITFGFIYDKKTIS